MAIRLPSDRRLVSAAQLCARVAEDPQTVVVGASPGATALVIRQLLTLGRPVATLCRDGDAASALAADLEFCLGPESAVSLFDAGERAGGWQEVDHRAGLQLQKPNQLRRRTPQPTGRPTDIHLLCHNRVQRLRQQPRKIIMPRGC